jgi:hypothetical protein
MDEIRNIYRILIGEFEGRDHLIDLVVDGTITLNWIFKKMGLEDSDRIHLAGS